VPSKTWTIIDAGSNTTPQDFAASGLPDGVSITAQTHTSGVSQGVTAVRIENQQLAFTVLPTRGMSLAKAWLGDLELGWKSPVRGPVHPAFVPLAEPSGIGWLDGFTELLVRCGLESNGAPGFDDNGQLKYPLHGRIANKPAYKVEACFDEDSGDITLTGVVEETRFLCFNLRMTSTYRTRVGQTAIHIEDTIQNLSANDAEFQMLYHTNFGQPLLDEGSQFVAPVKTLTPRDNHAATGIDNWNQYGPPQRGFVEQVYFMQLHADAQGDTRTLLKNAAGSQGVSLHCNTAQLPNFILWKNTAATEDGYVTGLEPATNFPNSRDFEGQQGRVIKLAGQASQLLQLTLQPHNTAADVQAAETAVAALTGAAPEVHRSPQKNWCEGV